jgi:hypothetical protein
LVSELLFNGKTLAEVAGYDVYIMRHVLNRRRDKYGRLVRKSEELPPWVEVDDDGMRVVTRPCSFASMYRKVKRWQGHSTESAEEHWKKYLRDNPRLSSSDGGVAP